MRHNNRWRVLKVASVFLASLVLAGCNSGSLTDMSSFGDNSRALKDVQDVSFYKTDQVMASANLQFKNKNYGKSYALYKRSVELFPEDPAAWLGYAASSDMIARFDNADKAYRILSGMIGTRPEYYNNLGYSQLLRGDLVKARRYFLKAYELDPKNDVTANNLDLLKNSIKLAQR